MQKQSNVIFHRSGVSWFAVPQWLLNNNGTKPPLIHNLSAGALRLYLYLLARSGSDQQPIVEVTNMEIAKKAKVTKNNVKRAREELEVHGLIRTVPDTSFVFEILHPGTGESLPTSLKLAKAREYTPQQIEAVFMRYLGGQRLDDNKNGMRFICPFHTIGMNSASKRTKHPLNVKLSRRGIWQCTDQKCRHHGKRRTEIIEDNWNAPVDLRVVGGGGDLLDFIVAITRLHERSVITRREAAESVEQYLRRKSK